MAAKSAPFPVGARVIPSPSGRRAGLAEGWSGTVTGYLAGRVRTRVKVKWDHGVEYIYAAAWLTPMAAPAEADRLRELIRRAVPFVNQTAREAGPAMDWMRDAKKELEGER